ncbi:hypothetical protein PAXRUDRAFT_145495, partial [Paxillus rubicundulus Ve08.2h10]
YTYTPNIHSSVLIVDHGRACIFNFGLSMLLIKLGGPTHAVTSHQGEGTLCWAAPELHGPGVPADEENPLHVLPTPQSDVYSFGTATLQLCPTVVLFSCIDGSE